MFAIFVALISGVFLVGLLRRWKKLFGLLIGIIFPLIMYTAFLIANDYSPPARLRKNGVLLARVIDEYNEDVGHYPQSLQT